MRKRSDLVIGIATHGFDARLRSTCPESTQAAILSGATNGYSTRLWSLLQRRTTHCELCSCIAHFETTIASS